MIFTASVLTIIIFKMEILWLYSVLSWFSLPCPHLFCYGVFCAFAGLSLFLAVMYGINRLIARWTGTGEGASVYAATISAILFTLVFLILGIRSFRKQYHEGELCDCTGDCEHCTIRCRSNPAFYGLKSSDSENGSSFTRTDI